MEKNRCLVTGGAGFVGSHLCEYLVNRGDHVRTTLLLYIYGGTVKKEAYQNYVTNNRLVIFFQEFIE